MTPEEEGRAAYEAALRACPYDGRSREGKQWIAGFTGGVLPSEPQVFIARESGVARVEGQDMVFVKNVTRVAAGHPVLKVCPDLFVPAEPHRVFRIEQATAAPGEKRNL